MPFELQSHFGIESLYAGLALEGIAHTATILRTLQHRDIFDYHTIHRAANLGFGRGAELWALQQLGVPEIVGIDNNSMGGWGTRRDQILAKTPNASIIIDTIAHWIEALSDEQFDLILTRQAPPGFWGDVNWDKVADCLSASGICIFDGDDDPSDHGFTNKLSLTWFSPDFEIPLPSEVQDITNGTYTIYQARTDMQQRKVQLARHT